MTEIVRPVHDLARVLRVRPRYRLHLADITVKVPVTHMGLHDEAVVVYGDLRNVLLVRMEIDLRCPLLKQYPLRIVFHGVSLLQFQDSKNIRIGVGVGRHDGFSQGAEAIGRGEIVRQRGHH